MRVTYIDHSGFFTETEDAILLFDFVKGADIVLDIIREALTGGNKKKPLYIFVSHTHADHYTKKIYDVAQHAVKYGVPDVHLLLSSDVPPRDVPPSLKDRAHFLAPHETREDALLTVETLYSNDTGVAFVLSVADGKDGAGAVRRRSVYFAGDLNAWNWDGDEEDMELIRIYHEELQRIAGRTFDLAFLPLDPRLHEEMIRGITDFFEVGHCDAKVLVPMHCWGQYEVIEKARGMADRYPYLARLLPVTHGGQVFDV